MSNRYCANMRIKSLCLTLGVSIIVLLRPLAAQAAAASQSHKPDARVVPVHQDICQSPDKLPSPVSRQKLAIHILRHGDSWRDYLIGGGTDRWRRIFADPDFCGSDKACELDVGDIEIFAINFFNEIAKETNSAAAAGANPAYRMSPALLRASSEDRPDLFFQNDDKAYDIICMGGTDIVAPIQVPSDTSKLRLRGISDDLYLDRNRRPAEFKSLSQATVNFGASGISPSTQTTKLQAAVGYALALAPNADLIPYIAASESISATAGKPKVFDPSNFAAGGLLLTADVASSDSYTQVITAKPQFLKNTTDHSEIVTTRLIYAPWTFNRASPGSPPFNLNTAYPIQALGGTLGQFLFDLRSDTGVYLDKGINPKLFTLYSNYERVGSRVGLAFNTPPGVPSFTLVVAETYQYGFVGAVRAADLFESSLAYNFDPNNFFSLKGSYRSGYEEAASVRSRSWSLGLAARY